MVRHGFSLLMACDGGHYRGDIQKHGLDHKGGKSLEMSNTAQGEEDGADVNRLASSYQENPSGCPRGGHWGQGECWLLSPP